MTDIKNYDLHKNADFEISFRVYDDDGNVRDPSTSVFHFRGQLIGDSPSTILDLSSEDSPTPFTIDSTENHLVTLKLLAGQTAAITQKGTFNFLIDEIDADSNKDRVQVGVIQMYEDIPASA